MEKYISQETHCRKDPKVLIIVHLYTCNMASDDHIVSWSHLKDVRNDPKRSHEHDTLQRHGPSSPWSFLFWEHLFARDCQSLHASTHRDEGAGGFTGVLNTLCSRGTHFSSERTLHYPQSAPEVSGLGQVSYLMFCCFSAPWG